MLKPLDQMLRRFHRDLLCHCRYDAPGERAAAGEKMFDVIREECQVFRVGVGIERNHVYGGLEQE